MLSNNCLYYFRTDIKIYKKYLYVVQYQIIEKNLNFQNYIIVFVSVAMVNSNQFRLFDIFVNIELFLCIVLTEKYTYCLVT